mgnify:CR=1 FL=1
MPETKPKHTITQQERQDIQAEHGGYPTLETITGVRDDYARKRWPKHTPWTCVTDTSHGNTGRTVHVRDSNGGHIATCRQDHAARIVLCVNSHDALVEALVGLQKAVHKAGLLNVKKHWDICTYDAAAGKALAAAEVQP